MPEPAHLIIIERIPGYAEGTPKASLRKIKEALTEYEYDEDFIDSVDDRFCQGFGAAKDIIVRMLSERYWAGRKAAQEQQDRRDETS